MDLKVILGRCHAIKGIEIQEVKSMQIKERHRYNKKASDEQI